MPAKNSEQFTDVVSSLRKRIEKDHPQVIEALLAWLLINWPNLDSKFNWPIPSVSAIQGYSTFSSVAYPSNANANIALKDFLAGQWSSAKAFADRLIIAQWVVVDWGGIGTNFDRTIEEHTRTAEKPHPRYNHVGIASLSKILAASDPDCFAVYDARVAAAMNAIQLKAKLNKGIAFRYGSGRNGLISGKRDDGGKRIADGFQQRNPISSLKKIGWWVPENGKNYLTYLALLFECMDRFPKRRLVELEMTLFANAVDVCRGVPSLSNNQIQA
jgi:hypothetical protein